MFYLKLAWGNLRKANQAYLPFILSSMTLFILLNTINLIWMSPEVQVRRTTPVFLKFAFWVIAIFALIIVLYSYHFLMKQRTKEFGLYSVLGMNRKRIATIASLELVMIFSLVVLVGSLLATVLAKFLYLVLIHLLETSDFHMTLIAKGYLGAVSLFLLILVMVLIVTWYQILRQSSLSLLRKHQKIAREPKGNAFLGFLGLLMIVSAYAFAAYDVKNITQNYLFYTFLAVLGVILGTYLLFMRFTIWVLKRQKNSKSYFYRATHIIPVSNMLYRMKQNAFGLANITILSCMVLTTLCGTTSLYLATNQMVEEHFPSYNAYLSYLSVKDRASAEIVVDELFRDIGASEVDRKALLHWSKFENISNAKKINLTKSYQIGDENTEVLFLPMKDYVALGNAPLDLAEGEVGYYHSSYDGNLLAQEITLADGQTYKVRPLTDIVPFKSFYNSLSRTEAMVVVPSEDFLLKMVETIQGKEWTEQLYTDDQPYNGHLQYTVTATLDDAQAECLIAIRDKNDSKRLYFWGNTKASYRKDNVEATAPFLFIGAIIGVTFLMGACLIMYYKQISEGYEDKKSYKVLQEIGMSQKRVKRTINGQVLLIFFAPLTVAVLHVSFAMPLMIRVLREMGTDASNTILMASASLTIGFILFYFIVYRITSRVYYKIIER
ncbi:ABC transporter permease [Streptococcus merionis]|uniref:ABC transporter permease n=1 Tax=Streptococcus merionis TaxID=400065 RepID=UPI0026EF8FB6|nr:ABC transporter permease [Streptococcus merionis]